MQLVSNKGDKFRIGRFTLCIGNRVTKEALQGIQVSPVPGYFDGMADGPLHPGRGGLEGFCHLGVEYLGDGVGVLAARLGGFWMQPENSTKIECEC